MGTPTRDDRLLRMANQIATFFRSYPDAEAVAGVHKHMVAFWTPRMIARLRAALPGLGEGADILVHRAMAGEIGAASPVRPAAADPHRLGEGASDAG